MMHKLYSPYNFGVRVWFPKELSEMVYEEMFVRIYDNIPFLFPKISGKRRHKSKLTTTLFVFINILTFVSAVPTIYKWMHVNSSEMSNFMEMLNCFYYICSTSLNLYLHLKPWNTDPVFFEDLLSFDTSLGAQKSQEYDLFLLSTLIVISTNTFSFLWFIPIMENLYALNLLLNLYYNFQAVGMKRLISKRVQLVVDKLAEEKEEETFGLLLSLRSILNYNTTVNKTYSLRIANSMGNGMATLLSSLCAYWRVYGLHDPYDSFELHHPYLPPFIHGIPMIEMLFMVMSAKDISDSVDMVAWDITRKISETTFSSEYREKMQVVVQELAHTSLDITALDLFTVDGSSFTNACGFVVNCMMVFIQFMK